MKRRQRLIQRLVQQAERMIQTGFSETMRTCGTPSCGCHRDARKKHGPHTYISFKTLEGRSSGMYVPPQHVAEVQQARAAWNDFWETARTLAAFNRQEMKERWSAGRKAKVQR